MTEIMKLRLRIKKFEDDLIKKKTYENALKLQKAKIEYEQVKKLKEVKDNGV